jgi:hypothetical protein
MLWLTLKERNSSFSWSYPPVASEVEQFGFGLFEWTEDPTHTQIFTKENYTKSYKYDGIIKDAEGIWKRTWTKIDATPEEIAQRTEIEKNKILKQRTKELRQSDFSQVADAPDYVKAKLAEWNTYRQALRDLPQQAGFPWDITFPQQPTK